MHSSPAPTGLRAINEVGLHLRAWRDVRGISQLDLSLDTGMSQRQISFIETGRSVPGRANLMRIADALDVPFRERNTLLVAAGYAPLFEDNGFGDERMLPVTKALQQMLKQHEPLPALVLDRYWNVILRNEATQRYFAMFFNLDSRPEPRNLLHLMFDPHALRPHIADWSKTAASLLGRVVRESVGRTLDERTRELIATLLAFPDVDQNWTTPLEADADPVVPLSFIHSGALLRFFSLVTVVGTPQTIAAQELRLECMFPLDEATERAYRTMMV